jgi:hypothetical protein
MKRNILILGLILLIAILLFIYYVLDKKEGFSLLLENKQLSNVNMNIINNLGKSVNSVTLTYDQSLKNKSNSCNNSNTPSCNFLVQNIIFTMNGNVVDFNAYINTSVFNNLVGVDIVTYSDSSNYINSDFSNKIKQVNKDGSKYNGVPISNYITYFLDYLVNGLVSITIQGNDGPPLTPYLPKINISNINITLNGQNTLSQTVKNTDPENVVNEKNKTIADIINNQGFQNLANVNQIDIVTNTSYRPLHELIVEPVPVPKPAPPPAPPAPAPAPPPAPAPTPPPMEPSSTTVDMTMTTSPIPDLQSQQLPTNKNPMPTSANSSIPYSSISNNTIDLQITKDQYSILKSLFS